MGVIAATILVATPAANGSGLPLIDPSTSPTLTTTSQPQDVLVGGPDLMSTVPPATGGTTAPIPTAPTPISAVPTPAAVPAPALPVSPVVPAPPPPPIVGNDRCGSTPGEPPGWVARVISNFSESTALGNWPGPVAARDWRNRQAGYRDSSGRGTYNSGKTVTEHDGVLDVYIHSEGDTRYVAAPIPLLGDTYGQRISLCMRADHIPGYKIAFLLWPGTGDGNQHGEIDFPEGRLIPGATGNAFMHYDPKPAGDPNKDAYSTGMPTTEWHVYTMEWNPGSAASQIDDYAAFYFDGVLIGQSTGAMVPDGPMHYVMQMETYLAGQELPAPASGHIFVDWVTISTPG